jgi:hypothetical protein
MAMNKGAVIKQLKLSMLLVMTFSCASVSAVTGSLKSVGQGTVSWLFIDIYQAFLFSVDGQYQPGKYPQALTIRYQVDISKSDLVQATKQQWQKLSVEAQLYQDWLPQLSSLWPDVKGGDRLTFLVSENRQGDFYHNDNWLGRIDDPKFSDAFLSIWLSEKSSEPALRKQLIGEGK